MNIQIFGKKKCFDTKRPSAGSRSAGSSSSRSISSASGMSGGEFDQRSACRRWRGRADRLVGQSPEIDLMRYTDDKRAKEDKLFDHPELMKTPIVRNGRQATAGYCPEVWQTWGINKVRRSAMRSAGFAYFFFSPPARSNIALLRRAVTDLRHPCAMAG